MIGGMTMNNTIFADLTKESLLARADDARLRSYSPYSGYSVGAALLCANGKIFTGCNIENASYTPTVCAERVAIFTAVAAGERDFVAIAVSGGKAGFSLEECTPCGVCRQVMSEFCSPDLKVVLRDGGGNAVTYTLGELLPLNFNLN